MNRKIGLRLGAVLTVALLGLAAASASAKEIIVNQGGDESASLGTLRNAINNLADPGDTITIRTNRITLQDHLDIPARLAGLTINGNRAQISGRGNTEHSLWIQASGITINNVRFHNVDLLVQSQNYEPELQGFTLHNSRLNNGEVTVNNTRDCRLTRNWIRSGEEEGISLLFTTGCVVQNNDVISRNLFAITDLESWNLTLHDNDLPGGGWLWAVTKSGRITANTVVGNGGIVVGLPAVADPLRVEGNTAPWMVVERSNVEIIRNTLESSPEDRRILLRLNNNSPGSIRGPMVVQNNTLTGGQYGITYSVPQRDGAIGVLTHNIISGCAVTGIRVNYATDVQLHDNEISRCGNGPGAAGIQFYGPITGVGEVSENEIHHIQGSGVRTRPPLEGGRVSIALNEIYENTTDGIQIHADAGVTPQFEPTPLPDYNNQDPIAAQLQQELEDAQSDRAPDDSIDPGVTAEPVLVTENTIHHNARHGVFVLPEARADMILGSITENDAAGVYADIGARVSVSQVAFQNNGLPGIDIAPQGVTPNDQPKFANEDIDWPDNLRLDPIRLKLVGDAAPGATVEAFQAEPPPRDGNPENGEGLTYLGSAIVDDNGRFIFPEAGTLTCTEGDLLTATARLGGLTAWTSEFSTNLSCEFPDPATADTDQDGVVDSLDACPDTAPNTVVDTDGCADNGANEPPVIVAQVPTTGVTGSELTLDASGSSDPEGQQLSFHWFWEALPLGSQAAIAEPQSAQTSVVPDVAGTYRIRLEVSDGENTEIRLFAFNVGLPEPNHPPTAVIIADTEAQVGDSVTLNGSQSSDPEGRPLTYLWAIIDAPAGSETTIEDPTAATTTYSYDRPGRYEIRLAVSDGEATDQATHETFVSAVNRPPIAVIIADAEAQVGDTVTLNGSQSSDPEGRPLTYLWTIADAPVGSETTIEDPTAATTTYGYDRAGRYEIRLAVSDGEATDQTTHETFVSRRIALDWGVVYCYSEDCTISPDGRSGTCRDCRGETNDSAVLDCRNTSASSTPPFMTITDTETLTGTDCRTLSSPSVSIDCTGATCVHRNSGPAICEGPAERCAISSDRELLNSACPANQSCAQVLSNAVFLDPTVPITHVSVETHGIGGNGEFEHALELPPGIPARQWVTTTNGETPAWVTTIRLAWTEQAVVTQINNDQFETQVECTSSTGDVFLGTNEVEITGAGEDTETSCIFANTLLQDSDGDGWPDIVDHCVSAAGLNGNECPDQGESASYFYWCNNVLDCSFNDVSGNCTGCLVESADQSSSIECDTGETCAVHPDGSLQCPFGGCDFNTPNLTGSCGTQAFCRIHNGFRCESDEFGQGCDGTFDNGSLLECPPGDACIVEVPPPLETGGDYRTVDVRKTTDGGDGVFEFAWEMWFPGPVADTHIGSGFDGITTSNGIGATVLRYYVPILTSLDVFELSHPEFTLESVTCNPDLGVLFGAGGPEFLPGEQDIEVAGSFSSLEGSTECTFHNTRPPAPPERVSPMPDGRTAPEAAWSMAADAILALNTTNPVVCAGSATGEVCIDVVSGEVPRAGSDRMSFSSPTPSIGVRVQPNEDNPGAAAVRSVGPGTTTYLFDPISGIFSFGILGFDNIIDLVHLDGDPSSETLISANRTRNQVDVLSPPESTGVGQLESFPLIESENLLDTAGQIVSVHASELGRLDCFNPCQETGAPMPSGCSAEIDAVLAAEEFLCDVAWGRTCSSVYSQNNGNICDLPASQRQASFGGSVLVLTDGFPGQVSIADPALDFFGRVTPVGTVGDDPRRLRCLAGICAVSNYGSSTLTILTWDGLYTATITGTVPVGSGPVGISLRQFGETIVILSTGSGDNTYTKTAVALDGTVISNETLPLPSGCEGSAHIEWVLGSTVAFATCTANDSYAVFEP